MSVSGQIADPGLPIAQPCHLIVELFVADHRFEVHERLPVIR
jgi:hypothetical protein